MEDYDLIIIGGGPAGLHAAAKAALLFRTAVVFDMGRRFSRIYWSPRVDNLPGQYGVSGRAIIDGGHQFIKDIQAGVDEQFITIQEETKVTRVEALPDGGFRATAAGKKGEVTASGRHIILATGCVDGQPALRDFRKRDIEAVLPYANKGLADYCLLCDGHTVKDKRVAVLGCGPSAAGIAASLKKNFRADTVVVAACNLGHPEAAEHGPAHWDDMRERLAKRDIPILTGEIKSFTGIRDGQFGIVFADGREERFDKAWINMGWYKVNNEAAKDLGAALDKDGFVLTDVDGRVQEADGRVIAGAYAIGDLRSDSWKQIPIAWGEAEAAVIDCFVSS